MAWLGTFDGSTITLIEQRDYPNAPNPFTVDNSIRWQKTQTQKLGRSLVTVRRGLATQGNLYLFRYGSLSVVIEDIPDDEREGAWDAFVNNDIVQPVVNVDEGFYTFQDAVDFHADEVFSTLDMPSDFTWIDENQLKVKEGSIRIHMATGWSADFGVVVLSDQTKDDFVQSSGVLTLRRLQHDTKSGSTVYAEGATSDDLFSHSTVHPRVVGQMVREETVQTVSWGAVGFRILYTSDDRATSVDEQLWCIQIKGGQGWEGDLSWHTQQCYNDQQAADDSFNERVAQVEGLDAVKVENEAAREGAERLAAQRESWAEQRGEQALVAYDAYVDGLKAEWMASDAKQTEGATDYTFDEWLTDSGNAPLLSFDEFYTKSEAERLAREQEAFDRVDAARAAGQDDPAGPDGIPDSGDESTPPESVPWDWVGVALLGGFVILILWVVTRKPPTTGGGVASD